MEAAVGSKMAATIVSTCADGGLDLNASTAVGAYNALVDAPFRLPGPDECLVIVIGNSRAIWPHITSFVRSLDPQPTDPVDAYVEALIGTATAGLAELIDVRYSHEPPPRRIAIQQLADVAGLAWLSPSHLCVHPVYGPWIALRAAIVLDVPAPAVLPARAAAPGCDCAHGCGPLLTAALASLPGGPVTGGPVTSDSVQADWRRWVAMRDGCPIGREHRYDDDQIEYHYIGTRPASWG